MMWHPISTVPRDCYVLLFTEDAPRWDGNMEVGRWFGDDNPSACFWSRGGPNGGLELGDMTDFTYWTHLPSDAV